MSWWSTFFDEDYSRLWDALTPPERTGAEVDAIWKLLDLQPGMKVLDAPCGYGRIARRLAERGARVTGVDQSEVLLARAEREREGIGEDRLRYLRHDLRLPLAELGHDVALNYFTSLGYGTEEEDLAILTSLASALRPGGRVLVETSHRDGLAARLSRGMKPAYRLPDGTLIVETPVFDAMTGRVETCWYWSGPRGAGEKRASIRVYTVGELLGLLSRAGLRFRSAHAGCSSDPFRAEGPEMGGRVALIAERPS